MLIPPTGPLTATIALIGEAPGKREALDGRPFVGKSGQLLNSYLNAIGLARGDLYITNLFKEETNIKTHFEVKQGQPSKISSAASAAAQQLRTELSSLPNLRVAIPLGNPALWALTGEWGIDKWRGSILERGYPYRVIPSYHPAFLLRQPDKESLLGFDLARAQWEAKHQLPLPQRTLRVGPTFEQMCTYLQECASLPLLSIDIETCQRGKHNWVMTCFGIAKSATDAMSFPLTRGNVANPYLIPEQEAHLISLLADLFHNPSITWLNQNIIYDLEFLLTTLHLCPRGPIHDTMIAARILWPDRPAGLDFLTTMHTREPYYKDDGHNHLKYGGDDRAFWIYNARDAAIVHEIFPRIETALHSRQCWDTYLTQVALIKPFLFMGQHGINFDFESANAEITEVQSELAAITAQLHQLISPDFNPGSTQQVMDYFYNEKRLKPYKSTTSGRFTADETALMRIARLGYLEAELILKYRGLQKYLSTYLQVPLGPDMRLHAQHHPGGAKTGRSSCRKTIFNLGINIQTPPRDSKFKTYLQADPGYLMYELDLKQAEGVLMDYFSNNTRMIDAFLRGEDQHAITASMISGLSLEEVLAQHKAKVMAPLGTGKPKTWRGWGKEVRLALNYLMGADRFSLRTGLSLRDATAIRKRYLDQNLPLVQFQKQTSRDAITTGLRNPLGRYRKFHRFSKASEIINFLPQSTVADVTHLALNRVYTELDEVILLNEIHDALLIQLPITTPERHYTLLKQIETFYSIPLKIRNRTLIIPLELKGGHAWGELHDLTLTQEGVSTFWDEKVKRLV